MRSTDLKLQVNSTKLSSKPIPGDKILERMPALALSGDDLAVDLILHEVLHLLIHEIGADVGQINLLPKGGRVEKVYVIKDGEPWLKKGMNIHLFNPHLGFTGQVITTGESILVEDIWAEGTEAAPNPFLELLPAMDKKYVEQIKRPVASIIIAPIKRGQEIFSTIEVGRHRHKEPFTKEDKERIDGFARRYGSLIVDYILDVKNRTAINTAHKKLLSLARLIASGRAVDYRDAVDAYIKLSAADIGFVFFRTGELKQSNYRTLVWMGGEIHEIIMYQFLPSPDSILRHSPEISFPVEGHGADARVIRFSGRIQTLSGVTEEERRFMLKCIDAVKSYVAYPLHLLGQDLGAIVLGSRRPRFWSFLHMNPFLALYNSLLKSFLLNERVIHYLSDVSLKIHNPGFYCLAALKGTLASKFPDTLRDGKILEAFSALEQLFSELHDQGKMFRSRKKSINLLKWIGNVQK